MLESNILSVLHDWLDEKARIIRGNLIPAMKRWCSTMICEHILPDSNAPGVPCMTDLAVMVFCSGLERTRKR